ncbi:hypothetical protein FKP32DRAFT_959036 [Trametes sanguinea]|nr:hypothetical protein FKP32DRAFT_959036 [Trametes sanguinea]
MSQHLFSGTPRSEFGSVASKRIVRLQNIAHVSKEVNHDHSIRNSGRSIKVWFRLGCDCLAPLASSRLRSSVGVSIIPNDKQLYAAARSDRWAGYMNLRLFPSLLTTSLDALVSVQSPIQRRCENRGLIRRKLPSGLFSITRTLRSTTVHDCLPWGSALPGNKRESRRTSDL